MQSPLTAEYEAALRSTAKPNIPVHLSWETWEALWATLDRERARREKVEAAIHDLVVAHAATVALREIPRSCETNLDELIDAEEREIAALNKMREIDAALAEAGG